MSIVNVVTKTSRVVGASYKILATLILGYYLIKDTIRRERNGRTPFSDGRGSRPK